MPVIAFSALCPDGRLMDAGLRLATLTPGMTLTTGQSVSGKVTMLLALAGAMAANRRAVVLLSDQPGEFAPFHPLPPGWTERCVRPDSGAWHEALDAESASDALLVVAPLNRNNARAATAVARTRWVFAALDTVLAGLDASYVLRDMGVPYEGFADSVRCVWSQFLVEALCDACAADAMLSPEELEPLLPARGHPGTLRSETGCAACAGRGTEGRVAISDVTFITDSARPVIRGALVQGVALALGPVDRIPALEQARELLWNGVIGIGTYRDAIQRNPVLRAQHALELVQSQSAKLTGLFDTFVRSLWLDLNVLKAVADRTTAGVIVAEEDGRIRFANARARQVLPEEGGLAIVDEHVKARGTRVARSLSDALARAVGAKPAATRLKLAAEGGATRDVFVTPLPTVRGFASGVRRLALIVLGGPGRAALLPSGQDLSDYFDLTPAEARVALLLCAGRVPKDAARELQVSVATVRCHVRALLEKTGTSRQTELVQLLSSLPRTGQDEARGHVPADDT